MSNIYMFSSILLLNSMILSLNAQTTSSLQFENITNESGLSNNNINAITSDKLGFIWVGTSDGLCRIETDRRIKIFRTEENNSLQSNNIRALLADTKGNIWIGTRLGGLTRFNQETGKWTTFLTDSDDPTTLSNNEVLSLLEDSKGRIWVGTENGLNLFHSETKTFTSFLPNAQDSNALQAKAILCITEDHAGRIWLGTWGGGLHLLLPSKTDNPKDIKFRRFTPIKNQKRSHNVWKVYQDKQQRYWLGTFGEGFFLMQLPPEANDDSAQQDWVPTFHKYQSKENAIGHLAQNAIMDIIQDHDGHLWIATGNGLSKITNNQLPSASIYNSITANKPKIIFQTHSFDASNKYSISNDNVNALHLGPQGLLWVGTAGGIGKYNPYNSKIHYYNLQYDFSDNSSGQNLYVDSIQRAWIGNGSKGVLIYDLNNNTSTTLAKLLNKPKFAKDIRSLYCKDDRNLYMGTTDGFLTLDMKTMSLQEYIIPDTIATQISNFYINSISVDSKDRVWLCTDLGLILYNPNYNSYHHCVNDITNPESISDNSITQVFEDSKGDIWVSTYNGLNKIIVLNEDHITFQQFKHQPSNKENSIPSNQISCITEADGKLYLGMGAGMCSYDFETKKFEALSLKGEQYFFNSLNRFNDDYLWGSTTAGIISYNLKTKITNTFNKEDGVADVNFLLLSAYQDKNGFLYFGSRTGITKFHPNDIAVNKTPPPIHITDIKVLNNKGAHKLSGINQSELNLTHRDYFISLNFAALNFNQTKRNKYAYRLEGFEEKWNTPEENNTFATYTNLDHGTYIFKVKAANNDGVWNEEGTSLKIIIHPAFWETTIFRISSLLALILLIIVGIKLYTKSVRERNQEMEKLIQNRTKQLHEKNKEVNSLLEQIKTRNTELEVIVAKRTAKLKESNEDLIRSNYDLEQFAYIASHDLQEPLRTIGSFASLLKRRYRKQLDENAFQYIDFVVDGVGRMSNLIKNILTYSKVGRKEAELRKTNLNEIINFTLLDLAQRIKETNTDIQVAALPQIFCSRSQISMVFYNLINNGIKFNKSTRPIIKIKQDHNAPEGFWKFSVEDNGIGIESDYQQKIFEIFRRLHLKSEYDGTGIGLALCLKIIKRHGGNIWVESEYGEGTTFLFTIRKDLQNQPIVQKRQTSIGEEWMTGLQN